MKSICVVIPTYNEQDNVRSICYAVKTVFETKLKDYSFYILFADNHSTDKTRDIIEKLCKEDDRVHAIFNARNYGQFNSPFNAICKSEADATITLCADFQDPPDLIPEFIKKWEDGFRIVCGVKSKSDENAFVRFLRSIYYKVYKKMSSVDVIEHFTGFGLYDREFVGILRNLDEPQPFIRSLVTELGYKITTLEYTQPIRKAGKSSNNVLTLYDAAMLSFTSYTKAPIRLAMIIGIIVSILSVADIIFFAVIYRPIYLCTGIICLLLGINLAFISLLGEYILTVKSKVTKRPIVTEEKRI